LRALSIFVPSDPVMSDTVDLSEITEYSDSREVFAAHIDRLAEMVLASRHCVIFTGAGVSTSTGIADYRGPDGVWTRKAQGRTPPKSVDMVAAAPTLAHRAIARMLETGRCKYLVSQARMRAGCSSRSSAGGMLRACARMCFVSARLRM
jgi:hypothetical protein